MILTVNLVKNNNINNRTTRDKNNLTVKYTIHFNRCCCNGGWNSVEMPCGSDW
jgi:hypothetical protein